MVGVPSRAGGPSLVRAWCSPRTPRRRSRSPSSRRCSRSRPGSRRAASSSSARPSSQVRRPSGGATTGSTPTATGPSAGPTSRSSRAACGPSCCARRRSRPPRSPSSSPCSSVSCPGLLLLTLVGSGWAYNAGLKRTWLSWLGYVVGFGALPAGVVAAAPGTPPAPWWLVARRGRAGRGRAPGQRGPRPRGRPGHRRPRSAAPPGRPAVGARSGRCCWAGRRSPWCSDRRVPVARPAGSCSRSPSRPWSWRPWPATPASGGAAFPAVLLLTVLDVVLLLIGGATVT